MRKIRWIALVLSMILTLALLCSCNGKTGPQGPKGETGPQGEAGPQGIQGETGPAGKDGASFLTGTGVPSNDLGSIGDSYMDLSGDEWGFYLKDENGWKLLGYLEVEPPPILDLSELNGSYALSHIVTASRTYHIGDTYYNLTLSADMISAEVTDGTGNLTVNFGSAKSTGFTCSVEADKFIMICDDPSPMPGMNTSNVFEMSIMIDGDIYLVLDSYGESYYIKKVA